MPGADPSVNNSCSLLVGFINYSHPQIFSWLVFEVEIQFIKDRLKITPSIFNKFTSSGLQMVLRDTVVIFLFK